MNVPLKILAQASENAVLAYSQDLKSVDNSKAFKHDSTSGFVRLDTENRRVLIAIAGTNEKSDWDFNKNLDSVSMYGPSGMYKLHSGFYQHSKLFVDWSLNSPDNEKWSSAIKNQNYKIDLVGHSLGGANAICIPSVLWAYGLINDPEKIGWIITFGGPRTQKTETAINYPWSHKVLRCTRPYDLVPDVPLHVGSSLFALIGSNLSGWSHIGSEYVLRDDSIVTETSATYQYVRRLKRLRRLFTQSPFAWSELVQHDHSAEEYRDLIKRFL